MAFTDLANLSSNEIIVICLGLAFGYRIVSKLITSSKRDQQSNDQAKPQKTLSSPPLQEPIVDQSWWEILRISQHATIPDIHRAYETLRLSYMPINRDRSVPISSEANERLQELDRAFRLAVESKKTP